MRFKVAKQDLDAALQVVSPSISNTGSDITTHFVFRRTGTKKDGYGVEVLTCSGRVFSSCPLIVDVEDPGEKGSFTVEGKRLKQWLAHVGDAALTFTLDETDVIARAPKGKQTFQSLNPDSRFVWDKTLKAAKLTATLPADRLAAALGYSRLFASVKESEQPELCVCEFRPRVVETDEETGVETVIHEGGILYSTDKKAVCLIRVEGMTESALRIHGKDVPGLIAFLGTCESTDVEVLEHERILVLRRGDGAVFGESRFQADFPGLKIQMDDADQHQWVLSKAEINEGIGFLTAGAAWEDNRLHFASGTEDDEVVMWMMSATGKKTELTLKCKVLDSQDKAPDLPPEGFAIDHFRLAKVLGAQKEDEVMLGINVSGARGFVRFVTETPCDKYLTIIAWLH
jgi:hypothetical protein